VRGDGKLGPGLRWGGAALLVAGLLVAYLRFPTRPPEPWGAVHVFELDSEECRDLRQERLISPLRLPEEVTAPVSVAEVARKFHLETALVCRANDRPAGCGATMLDPGAELVLPLDRRLPRATGSSGTAEAPP
jgi:hypothetical protein